MIWDIEQYPFLKKNRARRHALISRCPAIHVSKCPSPVLTAPDRLFGQLYWVSSEIRESQLSPQGELLLLMTSSNSGIKWPSDHRFTRQLTKSRGVNRMDPEPNTQHEQEAAGADAVSVHDPDATVLLNHHEFSWSLIAPYIATLGQSHDIQTSTVLFMSRNFNYKANLQNNSMNSLKVGTEFRD